MRGDSEHDLIKSSNELSLSFTYTKKRMDSEDDLLDSNGLTKLSNMIMKLSSPSIFSVACRKEMM